jgi:hypothetical protein
MYRPDLIKIEGFNSLKYKKRIRQNLAIFLLVLVFTVLLFIFK